MHSLKRNVLGFLAGWLLNGAESRSVIKSEDLQKAEFKTSTQAMGLRFCNYLRSTFRFKWVRRNSRPDI